MTNKNSPTQEPLPDTAVVQITAPKLFEAVDNAIGAVTKTAVSNDIYVAFRTFREELRKAIGLA